MSQFRLARLVLMLAALGAAPGLVNTAVAQNKEEKAAAEQKGPTVRDEVHKLIDPAQIQALISAKNFGEVQTRIKQAEALPNLTPYEQYAINRMKLSLAYASGGDMAAALEPLVGSQYLSAQEKDAFLISLGNAYYTNKNYPKAIEVYKRYQKEGTNPAEVRDPLIRAEYLSGDYAAAKADLLQLVAESNKAGKAPTEEDLKLLRSAAAQTKDDAAHLAAVDKLVANYPNDEYWADAVRRGVLRKPGYDATNDINVFRLGNSSVEKMEADEYSNFAEILLAAGFFTEAKKVLDIGFNKGVLSNSNTKLRQLREKANKGAADDAKTIASGEAAAAKSKTGAGLVNLGWAYVTMEQFDKGIGFIQQGIAKGSLKQADEAKLRLGIAQLRAGRKDEAIKIFQEVKAGGGLSDLAKYWIILANHPTAATAAAK